MKKIHYHKLVRDRIPQRIAESGGIYKVKVLDRKAFCAELLKKVGEEASGLLSAKKKEEIVSELGDVLDVIREIQKEFRVVEEELLS